MLTDADIDGMIVFADDLEKATNEMYAGFIPVAERKAHRCVRHIRELIAEVRRLLAIPTLFQTGDFTLASGAKSAFKIECDAMTWRDWKALAAIAVTLLPPFGRVAGVPRGGMPFAAALTQYETCNDSHPLLIAEDVVTTGGSMIRFRDEDFADVPKANVIGVCAFARGPVPDWVTAVWTLGNKRC